MQVPNQSGAKPLWDVDCLPLPWSPGRSVGGPLQGRHGRQRRLRKAASVWKERRRRQATGGPCGRCARSGERKIARNSSFAKTSEWHASSRSIWMPLTGSRPPAPMVWQAWQSVPGCIGSSRSPPQKSLRLMPFCKAKASESSCTAVGKRCAKPVATRAKLRTTRTVARSRLARTRVISLA